MSKAKQAGEKRGGGQDVIKGPSTNRNATQNQQALASLDIYFHFNSCLNLQTQDMKDHVRVHHS